MYDCIFSKDEMMTFTIISLEKMCERKGKNSLLMY